MRNVVFILYILFRFFVIIVGDGDWEYIFKEDEDGDIYGWCVCLFLICYLYDKVKNIVLCFVRWVLGFILIVGF